MLKELGDHKEQMLLKQTCEKEVALRQREDEAVAA